MHSLWEVQVFSRRSSPSIPFNEQLIDAIEKEGLLPFGWHFYPKCRGEPQHSQRKKMFPICATVAGRCYVRARHTTNGKKKHFAAWPNLGWGFCYTVFNYRKKATQATCYSVALSQSSPEGQMVLLRQELNMNQRNGPKSCRAALSEASTGYCLCKLPG